MKTPVTALLLFLLAWPVLAQVPNPQVPVTGNLGPGGVFPLTNYGTITISGNYTMAYPDMSASVIKFAGTLSATATITAPQTLGFQFTVENATTGGQSIIVKGTTGTGVTIPNGQTTIVVSDGTNYVSAGGGGSAGLSDPGANGIIKRTALNTTAIAVVADYPTLNQNTTGTAANITGTTNTTLTTLSALSLPYGQLSGTVPTWNQSTTGNAATATALSINGTANQIWGMNAGATAQGWQAPPSAGGPVYSQTFSGISMSSTAGPLQLTGTGCATSSPWACTAVTPTSGDTGYRINGTITQVASGANCSTSGSLQFWVSYTDSDSSVNVTNAALAAFNISATSLTANMSMGNNAPTTGTLWNILPLSIRVRNNTSLTFRAQQSVALGSGCTAVPTFTMRIALYPWP